MRKAILTLSLALAALAPAAPVAASSDPSSLLLLADYVGVDYRAAVADGRVADETEYTEMREFGARLATGVAALPAAEGRSALVAQARTLSALIEHKAPPDEVARASRELRDGLLHTYPVASLPDQPPDLREGARLYRQNCATCHGTEGRGDGPSAANLDPPPIDFHDAARARERSLFGLYNTITHGVEGTGMASFDSLSEHERWSLAFYVGSLFADDEALDSAEAAWNEGGGLSVREAVTLAPAELEESLPRGLAMASWARRHPAALFAESSDPLATAITRVEASATAYGTGDVDRALELAVSAYLEGFEPAEAGLGSVDPPLVRSVETSMTGFRSAIREGAPVADVEERSADVVRLLRRSRAVLQEEPLTAGLAFTGSLLILSREGLEAILILGAIAAFLVQTDRRDAMIYLHAGWTLALALGLVTWALAAWIVEMSGATREITEGVTGLVAAGILFYVGFWMHQTLNAKRWNRFLRERVQKALDGRTAFGLTFIAFVAVYREVFETVLFYQALWTQSRPDTRGALIGGALVGGAALVGLGWAVLKVGARLPLRKFFAVSGGVMFALAVVLAGKGVVALQEAGKLSISPVDFPRIEILGIYPNVQSLAVQLLLVSAAVAMILWARRGEAEAAG